MQELQSQAPRGTYPPPPAAVRKQRAQGVPMPESQPSSFQSFWETSSKRFSIRFMPVFAPLLQSFVIAAPIISLRHCIRPAVPPTLHLGCLSTDLDSPLTSQTPSGLFSLQGQDYELFTIFLMNLTCLLLYLANRKYLFLVMSCSLFLVVVVGGSTAGEILQ